MTRHARQDHDSTRLHRSDIVTATNRSDEHVSDLSRLPVAIATLCCAARGLPPRHPMRRLLRGKLREARLRLGAALDAL